MSWEKILKQGFRFAKDLAAFLELDDSLASTLAERPFPTRVPLGFALRMEKGNPQDPLLKQVLASREELETLPGYTLHPLEEQGGMLPQKGILHKYKTRVLLTVTGTCAVHCRYCFRRNFPYRANNPEEEAQKTLDYIASDTHLSEVILSGGDPFMLSNQKLSLFVENLSKIAHVKTVRIHSRMPVVLPERVDTGLLDLLERSPLKKVVVIHCNHPNELNDPVKGALKALGDASCVLFNQSVILAGVNDSVSILKNLSEKLFSYGVLPYYLHLLDKVAGSHAFFIEDEQVLTLYRELQTLLPGYLLPRLVREEPGKLSKTLVLPP